MLQSRRYRDLRGGSSNDREHPVPTDTPEVQVLRKPDQCCCEEHDDEFESGRRSFRSDADGAVQRSSGQSVVGGFIAEILVRRNSIRWLCFACSAPAHGSAYFGRRCNRRGHTLALASASVHRAIIGSIRVCSLVAIQATAEILWWLRHDPRSQH